MARRKSARAAKQAQRAKAPEINPCPPGQAGGQYKPLTDSQVKIIYNESLRILEQIGMTDVPNILEKQALAHGAKINSQNRLCFPASMVERIISSACKEFTFYGRESKHDIVVGGDKVYFGTGGAAVQTLDIDTEEYRPSTLADLYAFTRLIDQLPNVSWFTRCCIATDVQDNYELDVNTAYALLKGTTKPVGMSFHIDEHVDPIVDMFDIALGGKDKFSEKPFCKAHISPVISPLKYGEDAVLVALACMKRGVPINNIIAAISFGLYFKIDIKSIQNAIENYTPKNNRSEVLNTKDKKIILDAYNANPTSMRLAIDSFFKLSGSKALILADMLELGIYSNDEHLEIINHLEKENTGKTYLVGEEFYKLKKESNSISFYKTKNELILEISNNKILEKNILIKGSRAMKMEELINLI